jgi:hypothetical protein
VQLSAVLTQRPVSPAAETYEHDVDIVKRVLNGLLFAGFGREVSFAHGESLRERRHFLERRLPPDR